METITKLIEQEVENRVQDALTRYAKFISETHQISLALLLRDIPILLNLNITTPITTQTCLGVTAKGTRCTCNGKFAGYCAKHQNQCKRIQPIKLIQSGLLHNHGVPPLFSDTCPACIASSDTPRKKLVIDFDGIL